MVFPLYEQAKIRYWIAGENLIKIMQEEEEIFQRTQPKAVDYSKPKVKSSANADAFQRYLEAREQARIPERKVEAEKAFDVAEETKNRIKKELLASEELLDRIYVLSKEKYLPAKEIGQKVGYSHHHMYRILKKIDEIIKDATKCDE